MMHLLTHSTGSKCLFDTDTQTYSIIPDTRNKFFKDGKMFNKFDSISEFIQSDKNSGIVPAYCSGTGIKGKRTWFTFLDRHNEIKFFNVERISDKWQRNECELCQENKAYFLYVVREDDALNGCLVKRVMEIIKK